MEKTILQTVKRISLALDSCLLEHALIGGLAASIRGRARATEDVDLVIDCEIDEAIKLIKKLGGQGFAPFFPEVEQVVRQSYILALEDQTSKIKLDLAVGCSGFEKLVVQRAQEIDISGKHVSVATPEDLIIMKAMAGRAQDEQDIKGILAVHSESLDWHYCIDISGQLQDSLSIDLVDRIKELKSEYT